MSLLKGNYQYLERQTIKSVFLRQRNKGYHCEMKMPFFMEGHLKLRVQSLKILGIKLLSLKMFLACFYPQVDGDKNI